jgi:hypothetical protein
MHFHGQEPMTAFKSRSTPFHRSPNEFEPKPTAVIILFLIVALGPVLFHFLFALAISPRPNPELAPIPVPPPNPAPSDRSASVTFSVPPFPHELDTLSALTFSTWVSAFPNCRILLFSSGDSKLLPPAVRDCIVPGPPLETDDAGIAYADDFIQKSFELSTTDFLCIIMVDTILSKTLGRDAASLLHFYRPQDRQFAVLGRRCEIARPNGSSSSWLEMADDYERSASLTTFSLIQNADYSNDFILISLNSHELDFADVPPFHLGMHFWDLWLAGWIARTVPTVAVGGRCGSFHIAHRPRPPLHSKFRDNTELSYGRGWSFTASAVTLSLALRNWTLYKGHQAVAAIHP